MITVRRLLKSWAMPRQLAIASYSALAKLLLGGAERFSASAFEDERSAADVGATGRTRRPVIRGGERTHNRHSRARTANATVPSASHAGMPFAHARPADNRPVSPARRRRARTRATSRTRRTPASDPHAELAAVPVERRPITSRLRPIASSTVSAPRARRTPKRGRAGARLLARPRAARAPPSRPRGWSQRVERVTWARFARARLRHPRGEIARAEAARCAQRWIGAGDKRGSVHERQQDAEQEPRGDRDGPDGGHSSFETGRMG